MQNIHVSTYADLEALSLAAARCVIQAAHEAIADHGYFTIALSGGNTPKALYSLLAEEPYTSQIDWSKVEVFWSDERCVPPDSPDSCYRMAYDTLLGKVPLTEQQIHRVPAEQADRDAASQAYTDEMRRVFKTEGTPVFDLILLGMGPEGHTASLFPHQESLKEQVRLVMPVTVPKPPPPRLTFTPPVLNAAKHVLFLVTGKDKAEAVQAVLEGEYNPEEYPAQIVQPSNGDVTWLFDTGAASHLSQKAR
ncbi:6-phosphogluconolactonase [Thermosporothrix hazakensis]|jgi:6-phosphogluconolactonase|uniref:6-phosphogluconolactonase n=2 Tax=Thermosporothrix TaxID=768650 RepID=A0A326UCU6_THEHA|nr:6-phosphogluconolactonase [Thermosporothrix hazakensis]PZW36432.1 6-phosphogluconolactonase [Thermosporothrix hazakensis]BBH88899.1 6-phosphogluconolactonase [Thermosporothrix sp. COM3]GCE47084.1 6-phosphogluconolactonase [Thermosporothrix hazakensis]